MKAILPIILGYGFMSTMQQTLTKKSN